jgi:hypothetical protein
LAVHQEQVAVFYLARLAEGVAPIRAFIDSYRRHAAGISHKLIVIAKGYEDVGQLEELRANLEDIPCAIHPISDDIGMDIHAYRDAAMATDFSSGCFINTFSEINTDGWLEKLHVNFNKSGVGVVGATGSYESMYDSLQVFSKVSWVCYRRAQFDKSLAESYEWFLSSASPKWVRPLRSPLWRILKGPYDRFRRRSPWADVQDGFEDYWRQLTSEDGILAFVADIPRFPNPHIRTNIFMTDRALMLETPLHGKDKHHCFQFESGLRSLSRLALARNLKLLVVGADGVGYELHEWPRSQTFRLGEQLNLLAKDNQTLAYARMSPAERRAHAAITWGGYLDEGPSDVMGFDFSSQVPMIGFQL